MSLFNLFLIGLFSKSTVQNNKFLIEKQAKQGFLLKFGNKVYVMTKRKFKRDPPTGYNKSLGNGLINTQKSRGLVKDNFKANVEKPLAEPAIVSITHESNLEEFLANAQLAGVSFEAERGDMRILSKNEISVVKADDLKQRSLEELNDKYGELLRIPRRPERHLYNTPEELNNVENQTFLEWKRSICLLSEGSDVVLTPFERNLELWRQLWRVIERSDVVVQIVDARNPLLFRSADLEKYVKEVSPKKKNLLLMNKSDLLSSAQIEKWREYFLVNGIRTVFWSAKQSADAENVGKGIEALSIKEESSHSYIVSPAELLNFFKEEAKSAIPEKEAFVIGMIGYPNVGKSSTINCLLGEKKTSVSATPGKTKHFQTLIIDETITLCDCPGLVMPSFGFSPSEMILNAVLPISNIRDYFSPVQLLCNRIPRRHFELLYSVLLPKPAEHEPENRPPTAHELLTTVAFMKGFMAVSGIPDCSRSARLILNDVVNGKLIWAACPPGCSQSDYDEWVAPEKSDHSGFGENLLQQLGRRNLINTGSVTNTAMDRNFFGVVTGNVGSRAINNGSAIGVLPEKKKHGNRNKREKLRRVYGHLDA